MSQRQKRRRRHAVENQPPRMPAGPFGDLLYEFQTAYAKYGSRVFLLAGVTEEEWEADGEVIGRIARRIGFVQTEIESGGITPGYFIFATFRNAKNGRWLEPREQPCRCFMELAAKAGAALPFRVRDELPFQPQRPISRWLAFMWCQIPPSEETLIPPDDVKKLCRVIWPNPFGQAAEAIERGGLVDLESPESELAAQVEALTHPPSSESVQPSLPTIQGAAQANARRRPPPDHYIKAYQLHMSGAFEQTAIAGIVASECKIPFTQPQVSTAIKRVKKWVEDGNILPPSSEPPDTPTGRTITVDPAAINAGPRTPGRSKRQQK